MPVRSRVVGHVFKEQNHPSVATRFIASPYYHHPIHRVSTVRFRTTVTAGEHLTVLQPANKPIQGLFSSWHTD